MTTAATRMPALAEATTDPALVSDPNVTGVMFQFFSNNRDLFPPRFNRLHKVSATHTNSPSAEILPATAEVAVNPVFGDLVEEGFMLTGGFSYERAPKSGSSSHKTLFVMRFQFHRAKTYTFESEDKMKWAESILRPYFSYLTGNAYWKISAYNNVMESGGNAIGVKCSARLLTTQPDGSPLTRRPRDERGKPYGGPQPFVPVPQAQLRIVDGRLVLV